MLSLPEVIARLEAVETQLDDLRLRTNERLATLSRNVDDLAALVVRLAEENRLLRQSLSTNPAPVTGSDGAS